MVSLDSAGRATIAVAATAVLLALCAGAVAQSGSSGPQIDSGSDIGRGVLTGADFRNRTIGLRDIGSGLREALDRDLIAVRVNADGTIDRARSIGASAVRTGRIGDSGTYCFEVIGSDPIHVQAVSEQADFQNDDAIAAASVLGTQSLAGSRLECPLGVDDGVVALTVQRAFGINGTRDPTPSDFVRFSAIKPFYLVFVR